MGSWHKDERERRALAWNLLQSEAGTLHIISKHSKYCFGTQPWELLRKAALLLQKSIWGFQMHFHSDAEWNNT